MTREEVATHYVLLTWLYDAFNELPYLRLRGDYGSGKTRALLTIGSLCYKGFFASGASTVSPIFHTLDAFRGTLIFDEADFRFSDERAEIVKILNNGNVSGFGRACDSIRPLAVDWTAHPLPKHMRSLSRRPKWDARIARRAARQRFVR